MTVSDLFERAVKNQIPLRDVFMGDNIPKHWFPGGYICNLDKTGNPGTHYVAVWIERNQYPVYFDPFGAHPSFEMHKALLPFYYYSAEDIQNINSGHCGEYCLAFIQAMNVRKDLSVQLRLREFLSHWSSRPRDNLRILNALEANQFLQRDLRSK